MRLLSSTPYLFLGVPLKNATVACALSAKSVAETYHCYAAVALTARAATGRYSHCSLTALPVQASIAWA